MKGLYSDLHSADIVKLKIAKSSTDVATFALLDKIVSEMNYRGRILSKLKCD